MLGDPMRLDRQTQLWTSWRHCTILWLGDNIRSTLHHILIGGYGVLALESVVSKLPISLRVPDFLRDILKPFAAATW